MRLSVCMLAFNEQDCIARAIRSVLPVADEVVVVDTGSTDQTRSIAVELGARVFSFPWSHDFSAARNASLGAASGEWILGLDCDEELTGGSPAVIRQTLQNARHPAYAVNIRHEAIDVPRVRLGRSQPRRRFVGRLHESVEPVFESVGQCPATIIHWPSSPAAREAKRLRNLGILEYMIREDPDNIDHRINRCAERKELRHPNWTDDLGMIFRNLDPQKKEPPLKQTSVALELGLLAPAHRLPLPWNHTQVATLSERWYPAHCVLHGLSCWRLTEQGRAKDAIRRGELALSLWKSGNYNRTHPFNPGFLFRQLPATLQHARSLAT